MAMAWNISPEEDAVLLQVKSGDTLRNRVCCQILAMLIEYNETTCTTRSGSIKLRHMKALRRLMTCLYICCLEKFNIATVQLKSEEREKTMPEPSVPIITSTHWMTIDVQMAII